MEEHKRVYLAPQTANTDENVSKGACKEKAGASGENLLPLRERSFLRVRVWSDSGSTVPGRSVCARVHVCERV